MSATRGTAVSKARVVVSSVADPAELLAGAESRDRVTIRGAAPSFRVTVAARLHGPFRTAASIRCDQTPAWEGTWRTDGPGDYQTPAVKLDRPGWYVYTHTVPGDDDHTGVSTPCTDPRERVKVEVQPRVRTVVSSQRSAPGAEIFDRVIVEGLVGETGHRPGRALRALREPRGDRVHRHPRVERAPSRPGATASTRPPRSA